MATGKSRVMQPEDLDRAVRSVADLFDADHVVIVGSQALLVARQDIARELRMSEEFDAYPGNYEEWQRRNPGEEASEVINALLGEGSQFHQTHGFFVDGVDVNTAKLSPDWQDRAVSRTISVGSRDVKAVAPEPADVVAAKLARGDPKDIQFARVCLRQGLVKHDVVKSRLEVIMTQQTLGVGLQRLTMATRGSRTPGAEQGWGVG